VNCAVAVLSLIMKAAGGQEDIADAFANVGYLIVATVMAMVAQILLCYVVLFAVMTKSNPFPYLRCIIPAQTMAFACASSAATIPVTLKSVEATGQVPPAIAGFVIPLGATVNMDGGAIYFPYSCIWLAVLNGVEVNIGHLLLLVIISTIGSIGTAPVPVRTMFGATGRLHLPFLNVVSLCFAFRALVWS
jgi:Na+/H+-dicarboxylate symporter